MRGRLRPRGSGCVPSAAALLWPPSRLPRLPSFSRVAEVSRVAATELCESTVRAHAGDGARRFDLGTLYGAVAVRTVLHPRPAAATVASRRGATASQRSRLQRNTAPHTAVGDPGDDGSPNPQRVGADLPPPLRPSACSLLCRGALCRARPRQFGPYRRATDADGARAQRWCPLPISPWVATAKVPPAGGPTVRPLRAPQFTPRPTLSCRACVREEPSCAAEPRGSEATVHPGGACRPVRRRPLLVRRLRSADGTCAC